MSYQMVEILIYVGMAIIVIFLICGTVFGIKRDILDYKVKKGLLKKLKNK